MRLLPFVLTLIWMALPECAAAQDMEWNNFVVDLGDSFFTSARPINYYANLTRDEGDAVITTLDVALFDDAKSITEYADLKDDAIEAVPILSAATSSAKTTATTQPVETAAPFALPAPHSENIVLADANPLSPIEMGDLRGGFVDPTGLIIHFAVNVQTDINGAQIFTRAFTISPGLNGQLQSVASANLTPQNLPGNTSVGLIGNGSGVAITNPNGQVTTVLNQTAAGTPASIIMNTASNTSISQSVAVSLALKNLSSVSNYVHAVTQSALAQRTALRSAGF